MAFKSWFSDSMMSCGISGLLGGRFDDGAPFNNLMVADCFFEARVCAFDVAVFGVLLVVDLFAVAFLVVFLGLAMICSFSFIVIYYLPLRVSY